MANYADNRWTAFQYETNELMNMPEFKFKPSPALMKYMKNSSFLIPASEKERVLGVKQSDQDTVEVNIINKQDITTGNARAYNHTGSKNDGTKETITFTTYSADFTYSIKEAGRTIWEQAQVVSKQLRSAAIELHNSIETALMSRLNTEKSQVVVDLSPRSTDWDAANYISQIPATDLKRWMQRIKGFMREQYYRGGQFDVVLDETLFQEAEFFTAQGAGNQENLAWQIMGLLMDQNSVSQELTLDAGYQGMGYIWPVGTIGLLDWIPQQNREGFGASGEAGGLYTTIQDPLGSGLTFAVHEYKEGADNQASSGERQDVDVHVELSVDLGPLHAPMSTANADPVFKFGVQQ